MRKCLVVIIFIISFVVQVISQEYFSKVFDLDGIGRTDRFTAMIKHDDNLFLLARYDYSNGVNGSGTKVLKLDQEGNIILKRRSPLNSNCGKEY